MNLRHVATGFALLFAASCFAHDDAKSVERQLGSVKFPNSCSAAVQQKFTQGVAMLHSFWYSAAERTFQEVAEQDPGCAIAAWGFAAILMANPLQGIGA